MIIPLLLQAAAAAAVTPAPAAGWTLADRTNAAGVRSIVASVVARDGLSRLLVKCDIAQEPIVSIQFIQPRALGESADKLVNVRFDGGPAFAYNWAFPGTGAYITDPEAVTKLAAFMVKAKDVRVDTTNASNFAVEASFVAPGGPALIGKVLTACGNTLGIVPTPPPVKDAK
jgi:hypothetical protein